MVGTKIQIERRAMVCFSENLVVFVVQLVLNDSDADKTMMRQYSLRACTHQEITSSNVDL